ncbi:MAG: hypothetical protein C0501_04645 [Isosphaera sp.]|nr:hypothetical protein [Isosphaera sp.]
MARERAVLCGGAYGRGLPERPRQVELNIYGRGANVHIGLEAVRRALWTDLPPVLRDLLDVAVYVYAADQAVPRADGGRVDGPEVGAGWRRSLRFRVPVREPDRWNSHPVRAALVSALSFLSEDEYRFEFCHLRKDTALDGFIDFDTTPFAGVVEEVVMFSGGLDSLAGAVTEAVVGGRQVLLVHHRSSDKLAPHHNRLVRALKAASGARAPLHFALLANKAKRLGREFTQRTRSFLFAALGAVFARMTGLDRLRFYENGVTSLNLPPSAQVVGARASRTTHPRVLAGFGRLLTALFDRPFAVENPFQWDTKTDVVKRIADAGAAGLIGRSISCGHTWEMKSKIHTHCGVCSQCIDRRFAVLAAGQADHDPVKGYAVELLTGDRRDEEQKTMVAGYLDLAARVERMGPAEFFAHFGEVARALPHLGLPAAAGAARVFELYRKHARQVNGVIDDAIAAHCRSIRTRTLSPNCLLRLVYDDGAGDVPARAEPVRPAGNYFLRRCRVWVGRYLGGEEAVYLPERGLEYLHILFASPGRTFTASELAARVACRPTPTAARGVSAAEAQDAGVGVVRSPLADDTLDDEAVEALRSRLAEIEERRPEVEASNEPGRLELLDELDAELRNIRNRLGRDLGRGGRPRALAGEWDRVRNRVCNAIKRAMKQLREYDPPLADHLTRPVLNLGHTISYVPRTDIRWDTGRWPPTGGNPGLHEK